jgi:hypothetical protein
MPLGMCWNRSVRTPLSCGPATRPARWPPDATSLSGDSGQPERRTSRQVFAATPVTPAARSHSSASHDHITGVTPLRRSPASTGANSARATRDRARDTARTSTSPAGDTAPAPP